MPERYFVNADKTKIVPEGSPDAAFMLLADDLPEELREQGEQPKAVARPPADKARRRASAEDKG